MWILQQYPTGKKPTELYFYGVYFSKGAGPMFRFYHIFKDTEEKTSKDAPPTSNSTVLLDNPIMLKWTASAAE